MALAFRIRTLHTCLSHSGVPDVLLRQVLEPVLACRGRERSWSSTVDASRFKAAKVLAAHSWWSFRCATTRNSRIELAAVDSLRHDSDNRSAG